MSAPRPPRAHRARASQPHRTSLGYRSGLGAVAGAALVAAACSGTGAAAPAGRSPAPSRAPASATTPGRPGTTLSLEVSPAPYQLPAGVAGEVVLAHGPDLVIAGGRTAQGTSTAAIRLLNPVTGSSTTAGRLAAPMHDAAGATVGGRTFIFGGGDAASAATVQAVAWQHTATVASQLPRARSDLTAVTVGGTAYLLGGYDGTGYDPAVLATTDGRHFRTVARLPIPVRYPAVAALGGQIWVFGGQSAAGPVTAIQRITLPAPGLGSTGQGHAAVAGHLPRAMTGGCAFTLGGSLYIAGGRITGPAPASAAAPSAGVLRYRPGQRTASPAGTLPVPVANAGVAVLGGTAFLVGGDDGAHPVPTVTRLRLAADPAPGTAGADPDGAADAPLAADRTTPSPASTRAASTDPASTDPASTDPASTRASGPGSSPGPGAGSTSTPWLAPPHSRGHLARHSDPGVLPADILIADHLNNRLVIVDPQGRVRWQFPARGDLAKGQTFQVPDDAFFSPDGTDIIATQEDDSVISVINIATHRITYRYGTPGVPGAMANHLSNPDDAMLLPSGDVLTADIKNCRLLLVRPPAHRPQRIIGRAGDGCWHNPPRVFGSPNGAFPMTNGQYLVTEINQDWVTAMSLAGHVSWSTHAPGVAYPSDTNEVSPGRYLTADYSPAGQVVEFSATGQLIWRFGGLNHPSLALPLPNGDILLNDDYNNRAIVIDPVTNRIVWQYGHTGVPGARPGYLNDPDGVDLAPPDSLLITHAATMGRP